MQVGFRRAALGFLILFGLYQSAEGLGRHVLGSFPLQAGLMLLCLLAAWPVGRFVLRRRGFDAYALEWRTSVPFWLAGGLLLALVTKLLALAIGSGLGAYAIARPEALPSFAAAVPIVALALVSTFVPSLAEDIITRGFWWRVPGNALRGATFVLASSAIYVVNHIYRLGNGPTEWFMLFCFGIAYAVALSRTGSLWAALGVHWGWNLANGLLDMFVSVSATSELTWLISAAAHLAMAGIIPLAWQPLGGKSRGSSSQSAEQS